MLGAPGERIDLNLGALDQSGNWQTAVWSLAESDDYGKDTSTKKEVIIIELSTYTKNLSMIDSWVVAMGS